MASLSGMTLVEMRAATATTIKTAMKSRIDALTKAQLIRLELWVRQWEPATAVDVVEDAIREDYPDGQIKSRRVLVRDESGAKVRTVRHDWIYHPTGEVHEIVETVTDATDKVVSTRTVRHATPGAQPELVEA